MCIRDSLRGDETENTEKIGMENCYKRICVLLTKEEERKLFCVIMTAPITLQQVGMTVAFEVETASAGAGIPLSLIHI